MGRDRSLSKVSNVEQIVEQFKSLPGGLLPLLHAIKEQYGYVPESSVPTIAKGLNVSRAEVHGVISFYHDFNTKPVGKHVIQICRAEACQAMGSREIESHAKSSLGLEYGETSEDGLVTLEPVYCLGNCACSPSIRVDDTIYARVSESVFDHLIEGLQTPDTGANGVKL